MKWPFHKGKQIQRPTGNYRCTVELDIRLMFYEPCTKKDRQQAPEAKMEAWNTPSPETLTKEATMPWLPCAYYLECSLLISLSVHSDPSAKSNPLSADREPWHCPIPRIKSSTVSNQTQNSGDCTFQKSGIHSHHHYHQLVMTSGLLICSCDKGEVEGGIGSPPPRKVTVLLSVYNPIS